MDDRIRRAPERWRIVGILHADRYGELADLPAYLELASSYPDHWVAVAEGPSGDPGKVGQGRQPNKLCFSWPASSSPSGAALWGNSLTISDMSIDASGRR